MHRPLTTLPAVLCLACATSAAPAGPAAPKATAATPTPATPAPAVEPRALGSDARFGELIAAVQALLAAGAGTSSAGCLLAHSERGYLLDADLAPALQSVPDAPGTLRDALASHPTRARVLTTYGLLGEPAGDGLVVAALSHAPPTPARDGAFVLALTGSGTALRHTAQALGDDGAALDDDAALRTLQAHAAREIYVTAEAAVPLSRVYAVLAALPPDARPVLAVALPAGTRLPEAPPARSDATPLSCPDGLPEPEANAPEGELAVDALRAALGPLSERAASCLELAQGAAQAGGRLVLALRIDPEGRATHTCLLEDAVGDAQLAACVVEHARALRLPRPSPPGFVDVHLPLSLAPSGAPAQRGTCAR